jgi:hypothetical protein
MSSSPLYARAHTQVLLLLWHDPGVMGTHYAETQAYFRGTAVTCVLCPRFSTDTGTYMQVGVRTAAAAAVLPCSV